MAKECAGCQFDGWFAFKREHSTEEQCLRFLQKHGVVRSEAKCAKCGRQCREKVDQLQFRCDKSYTMNGLLPVRCNYYLSIKSNTWLKRSRLPLDMTLQFITMWLTGPRSRQNQIMAGLGCSARTVVDWSKSCREICINSLVMRGDQMLGGYGVEVEIDEAKLGRSKRNQGSWIFGVFERISKRCFFVKVPDRKAATLIGIIQARIAPGTSIISDRWRGYDPLVNHPQYKHMVVKQHYNFVDPDTGIHTKNIERTLREVRANIPRVGLKEDHIAGYLAEFCWKRKTPKNERIHAFFTEVALQFPCQP